MDINPMVDPVLWVTTANKPGATEQKKTWFVEAEADEWLTHYIDRGCSVTKTPLFPSPIQRAEVPFGWKLVPVEPTPEMIQAALDKPCFDPLGDLLPWTHITRTSYAALIGAVKEPPSLEPDLFAEYKLALKFCEQRLIERNTARHSLAVDAFVTGYRIRANLQVDV